MNGKSLLALLGIKEGDEGYAEKLAAIENGLKGLVSKKDDFEGKYRGANSQLTEAQKKLAEYEAKERQAAEEKQRKDGEYEKLVATKDAELAEKDKLIAQGEQARANALRDSAVAMLAITSNINPALADGFSAYWTARSELGKDGVVMAGDKPLDEAVKAWLADAGKAYVLVQATGGDAQGDGGANGKALPKTMTEMVNLHNADPEANKHLIPYITGEKPIPTDSPPAKT